MEILIIGNVGQNTTDVSVRGLAAGVSTGGGAEAATKDRATELQLNRLQPRKVVCREARAEDGVVCRGYD